MRNRFKLAAGGVGVAAVAASVALTGGTSAYFYDLEKSTGNQIEACDFDTTYAFRQLTQKTAAVKSQATASADVAMNTFVNGDDGSVQLANLQPGDSYLLQVSVRNAGSCAGDVWFDVDNHIDRENGLTEPEKATDNGRQSGDLGDTLRAKVVLDGYKTLHDGTLAEFATALPRSIDDDFTGGDEHNLFITLTVPNGGQGAENAIMTDSYSFDLDFAVTQKGHAPTGNLG